MISLIFTPHPLQGAKVESEKVPPWGNLGGRNREITYTEYSQRKFKRK